CVFYSCLTPTALTWFFTLSLHDALPICRRRGLLHRGGACRGAAAADDVGAGRWRGVRACWHGACDVACSDVVPGSSGWARMGMAADWGGTVTERTSCRPRELHPSWGVRSRGRQEVRCGARLVAPCRERPAAPQRRWLRLPGPRTR